MPLKRKPRAPARIPVGTAGITRTVKHNPSKEITEEHTEETPVNGLVEEYRAVAEREGITLDTALRSLPRGGMAIEVVHSDSATYSSIKVRTWLEYTFPDYNTNSTGKEVYEDLKNKIEHVVGETMEQIRKDVGI